MSTYVSVSVGMFVYMPVSRVYVYMSLPCVFVYGNGCLQARQAVDLLQRFRYTNFSQLPHLLHMMCVPSTYVASLSLAPP